MTFGNNLLSLSHSDGVEFSFNGLNALAEVGTGEGWEERTGGAVLVSMAETWGKNRYVPLLYLLLLLVAVAVIVVVAVL